MRDHRAIPLGIPLGSRTLGVNGAHIGNGALCFPASSTDRPADHQPMLYVDTRTEAMASGFNLPLSSFPSGYCGSQVNSCRVLRGEETVRRGGLLQAASLPVEKGFVLLKTLTGATIASRRQRRQTLPAQRVYCGIRQQPDQ